MGEELREDLARDKADRHSEVEAMLSDFGQRRRVMRAELRRDLAQSRRETRSEVEELQRDLAQSRRETRSEVEELQREAQELVRDLGKARKEMGEELREDLARDKADRRSEVRADLKRAADAWQELARPKLVVELGPAEEEREEQAETVAAPMATEAERENLNWEESLLAAIRAHPEGITLTEVAEGFGVAPVVLGRAVRNLLDQGKIQKSRNSYFPLSEEEG
jgi:gas vesicle protein